eukprot:TRINITY_DN15294_c0_g1_i3.p1 TRINITY_DN15294_c0_g1~~TRINITY_DN15294_c0_g1_i3.p1  ORF type:complete len:684 (+),score=103.47 TRINITY_DN15294_c0_g1_i3:82-2133(+)
MIRDPRFFQGLAYDEDAEAFTNAAFDKDFIARVQRRERKIRTEVTLRQQGDASTSISSFSGGTAPVIEDSSEPAMPQHIELTVRKQASVLEKLRARMPISEVQKGRKPIVEHIMFDVLVGISIVLNTMVVGLEVDTDLGTAGLVIKNVTVAVWVLEVIAKLCTYGPKVYFWDFANLFDFVMCLFALSDLWVTQYLFPHTASKLGSFTTMRILRVFRLIRVLRLLIMFRELWLLVLGLLKASAALCWVVILIMVVIYSFAIFFTVLVGKECDNASGPFGQWEECAEFFGTMAKSMYTLFEVMTLDLSSIRPMIMASPWLELPVILFIMATSFGLLNIIMGIIVDQVLESANHDKSMVSKQQEAQRLLQLEILRDIFTASDSNRDCQVSQSEFVSTCDRPDVQALFEEFGVPVSRQRLAIRLFQVLDADGLGVMELDTFVERAATLLREGKMLSEDATLLLMDVRSLDRHMKRFEQETITALNEINTQLTSLSESLAAKPKQGIAHGREKPEPQGTESMIGISLDGIDGGAPALLEEPTVPSSKTSFEGKTLAPSEDLFEARSKRVNVSHQKASLVELGTNQLLEDLKSNMMDMYQKVTEQDLQLTSVLKQTALTSEMHTLKEQLQSQLTAMGSNSTAEFVQLESRLGARLNSELKGIEESLVSELMGLEVRFTKEMSRLFQIRT